jgi:hypothetical protein
MDGTQFDTITQRLAAAASRRRILSGVLGGAAVLTGAALAGLDDADAKKGKGKAKGKGKGKNNGNGGNGGGNGKGKAHGKNKVAICHENEDGTFSFKKVPAPALKQGHRKHGDTICGETEPGTCQTSEATGCNPDGTCIFTQAPEGDPCVDSEGAAGTCNAVGVCVPTPPV